MRKIGPVIQQLRIEKKMSRSQLAALVNLSCSTIWNLEHDYANFTCKQLRRFAAIFGYTIWETTTDQIDWKQICYNEEKLKLISKLEQADHQVEELKETIVKLENRVRF